MAENKTVINSTEDDDFPIRLPKLPTLSELTDVNTYDWHLDSWQGVVKTILAVSFLRIKVL